MPIAPMDGNVVAGILTDIFRPEMTIATTTCANCGAVRLLGELYAFLQAPGVVLRCPNCDAALLRLVQTNERAWLDLRGMSVLQMELPRELGIINEQALGAADNHGARDAF
jgi:hypothetical protein